MLEAVIIGRGRSTPGLFSMRRRILRLRRASWRWTLAFTRKPPGGRTVEGGKYLDCSPEPGGFRVSRLRSASNYAWLRSSSPSPPRRPSESILRLWRIGPELKLGSCLLHPSKPYRTTVLALAFADHSVLRPLDLPVHDLPVPS